jgi:hypothetical protein
LGIRGIGSQIKLAQNPVPHTHTHNKLHNNNNNNNNRRKEEPNSAKTTLLQT